MAPWAALGRNFVILEGLGRRLFFYDFSSGEKSADKSLKICPGRPRGSPGDARSENANAEPVPRRGEGGR